MATERWDYRLSNELGLWPRASVSARVHNLARNAHGIDQQLRFSSSGFLCKATLRAMVKVLNLTTGLRAMGSCTMTHLASPSSSCKVSRQSFSSLVWLEMV